MLLAGRFLVHSGAVADATTEDHGEDHFKDHDDSNHQGSQTNQVELLREQLDQFVMTALRFQKIFWRFSGTQCAGDLLEESGVVSFTAAVERSVENVQHLDGGVFAGRPCDIHSFDVRRVVEVDQFFGDRVPVHETPHRCSHLTSEEDHQKEEECSQEALGFLDGTVTTEEAHKHHHSPNSDQYVHTDVEGAGCLLAFQLEYEEVAGLTVMTEPQRHS